MIDGTFPVMAMVLSVAEKRECNRDEDNLSSTYRFSLAIVRKAVFIESRHESRSWPSAKLRS
jgi:hypothetical protein